MLRQFVQQQQGKATPSEFPVVRCALELIDLQRAAAGEAKHALLSVPAQRAAVHGGEQVQAQRAKVRAALVRLSEIQNACPRAVLLRVAQREDRDRAGLGPAAPAAEEQ